MSRHAVHVARWCTSSGDVWVAVVSPYSRRFVERVKAELPRRARWWNPELRVWMVAPDHRDHLLRVLRECFGARSVCPSCAAGCPCDRWQDVAAVAAGTGAGHLWVAAPSLVLRAALAALGLPWPTTPANLRAAYARAALVAHPDRGGDHERMINVNRARDLVLEALGGAQT